MKTWTVECVKTCALISYLLWKAFEKYRSTFPVLISLFSKVLVGSQI